MGELIVNGIKMGLVIAAGLAFMVVLSNFITMLSTVVFGGVIGEFFGIVSCCLPFNALAVFSAIGTTIEAILSFLVAQKIWNLVITTDDAV